MNPKAPKALRLQRLRAFLLSFAIRFQQPKASTFAVTFAVSFFAGSEARFKCVGALISSQ